MQWLSVAAIWIALIGGLAAYLVLRGVPDAVDRRPLAATSARVVAELHCTTGLGGAADPFAADPGAAVDAVVLRWGGAEDEEGRAVMDRLTTGAPARLELDGLVAGRNELLLEAAAPPRPAALRLVIARDADTVLDRTWWLSAGEPLVTSVLLDLGGDGSHGHDH